MFHGCTDNGAVWECKYDFFVLGGGYKKTPPYVCCMVGKGIRIGESVRYRGVYPIYPFYDGYVCVAVFMVKYTLDS